MKTVWVLTEEHNAYDQYGEYFLKAFINKPTAGDIAKVLEIHHNSGVVKHILNGGGRIEWEDIWWWLREEDAE